MLDDVTAFCKPILQADSYDFDIVVFDEASQVHTEDAIGAIMRENKL